MCRCKPTCIADLHRDDRATVVRPNGSRVTGIVTDIGPRSVTVNWAEHTPHWPVQANFNLQGRGIHPSSEYRLELFEPEGSGSE